MSTLDDPWATVAAVNEAWTKGDVDGLRDLFHPGMVIAGADLAPRSVGRDACGTDVFVLIREAGRWQAIWRQLSAT